MDCNKDEAIRARELSEKKMAINDFESARTIALKAQRLYPELENIGQLLSVCNVHCSAQKRINGSEKDWYAVLQVDRLADEPTIKKQYRRLALTLHPDKNRLPGAEAAFKLISEANAVLTDTSKKLFYDSKIRVSAPTKPPPHMNRNHNMNQRFNTQNNPANGFRNLNQQQATGAGSSFIPAAFVTRCPYCQISYRYAREHVNKTVCCQTCRKPFMACEISVQGVPGQMPSKNGFSQPSAFHEKVVLNKGYSKVGVQNAKGSSTSHAGVQGNANMKTSQQETNANGIYTNYKRNGNESGELKNKSGKRARKMVDESSESVDSSDDSDTDDEIDTVKSGDFVTDANSGTRRRSSRLKQNISYNESDEAWEREDTKLGNQKKANDAKSEIKKKKGAHVEENLKVNDDKGDKQAKSGGETRAVSENGDESTQIESESDPELESGNDADGIRYECPDPEFHDFEMDRDANLFKAGQIWACYDDSDGMPRFYAKLTKASSFPFEVSFKWLEAVPISEAFEDWINELPVGCGNFKIGAKVQKTCELFTFSHQMVNFLPIKKRGSLILHPKEGEIWAVIKDWDITWMSSPENHRELKYEIVEVISDFVDGAGCMVCYLEKVAGFVSLFHSTNINKSNKFWIRPDELYKFSHLIPSSKMSGSERDGVPIGSYELDPAALPLNPDHLHFPGKIYTDNEKMDSEVRSPPSNAVDDKRKSEKIKSTSNQNGFIDVDDSDSSVDV